VALVSALWTLALLSSIALSLLFAGNVSYKLAHNNLLAAQEETVTEAVINRAVLALLDPRADKRWRADGVFRDLSLDGTRVRIRIQDELGRIDLNHADGSVLVALFQSIGLDPAFASALVDKILDWRDTSPLKHLNGAKDQEYREAGLAYGPRNGPFQGVDELKLVMGMTPALFKRVEPALTVYSGRPFIDPQIAPPAVLLAIPGMDANQVASLVSARVQQAAVAYDASAAAPGGLTDPMNALKGRAFSIRAELATSSGAIVREATIRLTGNPEQPYWVLNWVRR
jgi:general secretion pathway protein K